MREQCAELPVTAFMPRRPSTVQASQALKRQPPPPTHPAIMKQRPTACEGHICMSRAQLESLTCKAVQGAEASLLQKLEQELNAARDSISVASANRQPSGCGTGGP